MLVIMSALQHRLEWSQTAFSLLSFAQMWSTANAVTRLRLALAPTQLFFGQADDEGGDAGQAETEIVCLAGFHAAQPDSS